MLHQLAAILTLLLPLAPPTADVRSGALPPHLPIPIRVQSDQSANIVLDGGLEGASYLVLVGSLATDERAHQVDVELAPTSDQRTLAVDPCLAGEAWRAGVTSQRELMRARRQGTGASSDRPEAYVAARFAQQKSFFLFVREDDFYDRESYHEVVGNLAVVGKHCLVYVDREDEAAGFPPEVAGAVATLFDERVQPMARELFGRHSDVDRDGKFTILFTHWLGNLSNGKVSIGGFVRGSDFLADLAPPFSNRCDMMYLNSNLRPGEHLTTLVAHEYTHAITFSEHTHGDYLPGEAGEDEETWLSEAIAHLAENLIGSGWSNLDYRVSTYLSAPGSYRLVVPDYYRAGLWRCHGSRGSTYLFLRWCVDRFGPSLLNELSRSNLEGVRNLEVATETPFEQLFRDWSVAMCLPGHGTERSSIEFHGRLEGRLLAGPRPLELTGGASQLRLEPTSWRPTLVRVAASQRMALKLHSDPDAALQVTLARMPADEPRVRLAAELIETSNGTGGVQVTLHHEAGRPVEWQALAIEPESLPQTKSAAEELVTHNVDLDELVDERRTAAGGQLLLGPVTAPRRISRPMVVKLVGRDDQGRGIGAWATLLPGPSAQPVPSPRLASESAEASLSR